jgi:hypothetical protein
MIRYERTKGLTDVVTHYCPGCTHGILHKLVGEVLEELGVLGRTVGIASVGCSVFSYEYFNCDMQQSPHGRACAMATGVKRVLPDRIVFTYQGDGDLGSIGIAEAIHAANRGENFTVILANNATYGMTGGQMAPTSLIGQTTTTSQYGRNVAEHGSPLRISELFSQIQFYYPFYDPVNPDLGGRFMNTLVNIDFIVKTLRKYTSSDPKDGEVLFVDFIQDVLNSISKACGGFNEFRIVPDDDARCIRIFDDRVSSNYTYETAKYLTIPVLGKESIVYGFSYSSKISPQTAAQIVIAAQAKDNIKNKTEKIDIKEKVIQKNNRTII